MPKQLPRWLIPDCWILRAWCSQPFPQGR
jgi:hypothetical protein